MSDVGNAADEGEGRPDERDLLSRTALAVFRLNGQFLEVSERLARPVGLTAAWWQVLGAVLPGPLPVAGIARAMGITRQSVQRIADLLVERGLAETPPDGLLCVTGSLYLVGQVRGRWFPEAQLLAQAAELGRPEIPDQQYDSRHHQQGKQQP